MSFLVFLVILILIVCFISCYQMTTDNHPYTYRYQYPVPVSKSNPYPIQDSNTEYDSYYQNLVEVYDENKNYDMLENFQENNDKYELCIMAIFKNEENYLEEWLLHHKKQGISHVYLYAHDPDLKKYPYLSKYKDWVTLIPFSHKKNNGSLTIQRQAYNDCVKTYDGEYKFLMMLDIDEFLISTKPNHNVMQIIEQVDPETKAIKVPRYDFGSNGHIKRPLGNVMDNYTKHEKLCSSYKTIAHTDYIDKNEYFYGVHDFPFTNKEGKIYNEYLNYKKLGYPRGCDVNKPSEIPLVINHYYAKSQEEYLKRCDMWKSGGVNNFGARKDCENKFKSMDLDVVHGYDYPN